MIPGTTQISNQGTVSGSNFSNVLTDDTAVGGASDPTITPVDRPDTTVVSLNRSSGEVLNKLRQTPYLLNARSSFEDTRRKAAKFGAYGTTVKAYKPQN